MNTQEARFSAKQWLGGGMRLGRWLLAIALFLLLLPEILRFALIQWVPNTGIGELAVKDVDLNLFSATVGLEGVIISRDGESRLALDTARVDISWLKLLLGQLHIESAWVDGLRLTARQMEDGGWEVVVPLTGPAGEAPSDSASTADDTLPKMALQALKISNAEITVASPMASGVFAIDELTAEALTTWKQAPAEIALRASWQQAPIILKVSVSPWIEIPVLSGSLEIKALPLAGFQPLQGEPLAGLVDSDLRFLVQKKSLQKNPADIAIEVEGDYRLSNFKVNYRNIGVEHQQLDWKGRLHIVQPTQTDAFLTYSVNGDIRSSGFTLRDREQDINLLHWQSLAIDALALNQGNNLTFEQLVLNEAVALDLNDDGGRFYTGVFEIRNAQLLAGARLHIDEIILSKGQYDLLITEQGTLQAERVLKRTIAGMEPGGQPAAEQNAAVVDQHGAAAATPVQVTINKLRIEDDTEIRFTDRRFSVPVAERIIIEQLTVVGVDQVDPDSETILSLKARIGEFSTLSVNGEIKPFAETMVADIQGELHAVELPAISPYAEAYLGYHLSRGQYDHQFAVRVADDKIDLNNTLRLRQLKLESVDPGKPQPLERQLDVPLVLALDMLRDGKDNIELKVPIKGRLDDPAISINNVINNALANALKNGAANYLKFALQPYGAMLMAAEYVGGQMTAIRLQPLLFAIGSDAVPAQGDYIDKLLGLLQQRPQLHLTLCGFANQADSEALLAAQPPPAQSEAALAQLAERRAKNVKRLFLEKGVASDRLLLCQPRFDAEAINGVQLAM